MSIDSQLYLLGQANSAADAGMLISAVMCLFMLGMIIVSLLLFILWIWMIVDCASNEPSEGNDKIVWLLIILLVGPIGAVIYYFFRRPTRKQIYGR